MNQRELKLFRHLAGTLHFGRTSRACHVTPSALTRTVQRLEEELGQKLFIRDNRSVMLTPAGEMLRLYADEAIRKYDLLLARMSEEKIMTGEISLYCSVTAAYSILPAILQKFREKYPDVHINLQTGDAALALNKLQNREVDITVAALPDSMAPRVDFLELAVTPLVFIGPGRFPETIVFSGKEIDWHQTPIIMAEQGLGRERTEKWFREKGLVPNVYAQVAGNEAIIAMVALGCGAGVVPQLVVEKSPLQIQVKYLPVFPELAPFSIGVCVMKKSMLRPQVSAFWEIARDGSLG